MTKTGSTLLALVALLAFGPGCEQSAQPAPGASTLPTVKMKIGSRTFELEMARTSEQQALGLMRRDSMPENHGMIFIFDEERMQGFWMKDTRIPLDIIFVDAKGKVVSVSGMKPYDLNTTSSEVPAQYAIELNAGMAKAAGVKSGDVLEIPKAARYAPEAPATAPATAPTTAPAK